VQGKDELLEELEAGVEVEVLRNLFAKCEVETKHGRQALPCSTPAQHRLRVIETILRVPSRTLLRISVARFSPSQRGTTAPALPQSGFEYTNLLYCARFPRRRKLTNSFFPPYMGTSLIRKRHPLGPYSRHMRRALWRS